MSIGSWLSRLFDSEQRHIKLYLGSRGYYRWVAYLDGEAVAEGRIQGFKSSGEAGACRSRTAQGPLGNPA